MCLDLTLDTETDDGTVFKDNEKDYVYCASVALSPIRLSAEVLERYQQQQQSSTSGMVNVTLRTL